MKHSRLIIVVCLLLTTILFQGCECSNSSRTYQNSYPKPYTPQPYRSNQSISNAELQELLKQLESSHRPVQRQRIQRSEDWERGYSYGWDLGYEDAVYGSGAWASYNSNGKGGDFLDGYENGYIDGYESGKDDRNEDDEEIEDL